MSVTRAFWSHGYHGTSTETLCKSAGLGRSSLYNAFGSKSALFAECLSAYLSQAQAGLAGILNDEGRPVPDRIRSLFEIVVQEEVRRREESAPTGCLGVHTVVELAEDPEWGAALHKITGDTEARIAALATCVRAGQARGEVSTELEATALATFINATIAGMRVASRGGAGEAALRQIASVAMRSLMPASDAPSS
jgi:TetR/AcrR family transcriptional regulator, transcriptional repressor for nem operon